MKKKKANVRYKDHCDNCLTDQTPQWRKGRRGETFCQDCGRSERRHDYARLKRFAYTRDRDEHVSCRVSRADV
jgi:hypothetical protein